MYNELQHQELAKLKSCVLIDEFEKELKSKQNYKDAISYIYNICPQLIEYSQKFVIPFPGDWPTWFYTKKIIAQETNIESPFFKLVPEQGPWHVHLNIYEDIVENFHFLFRDMYKEVFGGVLPQTGTLYHFCFSGMAAYPGQSHKQIRTVQRLGIYNYTPLVRRSATDCIFTIHIL